MILTNDRHTSCGTAVRCSSRCSLRQTKHNWSLRSQPVVSITSKVLKYLQNLAGEQEAMHYFSFEELTDVEDLMRVVDPDEDL